MAVSSIGIGSGVLTSELIDSLVEAERAPTELRLDREKEDLDAQLSAYGKIQSSLQEFRLPARVLSNPNALLGTDVSSSASEIEVSASSSAPLAEYTVDVSQTAQAHSLVSGTFATRDSDILGTGTLRFELGTYTTTNDNGTPGDTSDDTINFDNNGSGSFTVPITSGDLDSIAKAVNEETTNTGIRADVVDTGSGFVLVFSSEETGAENAIRVTAQVDGDSDTTDNAGLSQLTYTENPATERFMTETQNAQDAMLTVNGLAITSSSNKINDVISGVTLDLNGVTTSSAKIKVTRDASVVGERIQDLVDAYNGFKELMDEYSTFDPDNPETGLLLGDSTLRNLENQVDSVFGQVVSGMENANVRSLAELGLTLSKTENVYEFDQDKFNKVFDEFPEDVAAIFSQKLESSSSRVDFKSVVSGTTAPGSYDYSITQLASQGSYTGVTAVSFPADSFTVTAGVNDAFKLEVNGVASGQITLTAGAYDGAALALEIQSQINNDSTLKNNSASVVVAYDSGTNSFSITSDLYKSSSSVAFTEIAASTENDFGFSLTNGTTVAGKDAEGTINGVGMKGTESSGTFTALSVLSSFPFTVDANNDEFSISVDGITSGILSLTQQAYASGGDLATEVQNQINADPTLLAAGKSVTVSFDTDKLIITSDSKGTSSTVSFASLDTNSSTDLGFSLNSSLSKAGEDFTTTGVTASGNRLELDDPDNAADGVVLNALVNDFQPGETEITGTANYVSGVADELVSLFNGFLAFDGLINNKTDSIKTELKSVDDARSSMEDRLKALEDKLTIQFISADLRVSQLKNTEQFVTTQLAAIVNSFTNSDK
ncbi:flagellar filament capping protein FliD [Litoribacillus peritrichatus]|uniref:Flagellar hook-associated protein 2 n=1 Tax=Litoribacillus peritrichatus TaxID=718191 RepID=A0ABP7M3U9_9GAMM